MSKEHRINMEELRDEIRKFAFEYEPDRYDSVDVQSQIIQDADLRYHETDNIVVVLNINDDILDEISDIDKSELTSNEYNLIDIFSRDSRVYKYCFTLLRTLTDLSKLDISQYILNESTIRSYYVRNVVEVRININTNIVKL